MRSVELAENADAASDWKICVRGRAQNTCYQHVSAHPHVSRPPEGAANPREVGDSREAESFLLVTNNLPGTGQPSLLGKEVLRPHDVGDVGKDRETAQNDGDPVEKEEVSSRSTFCAVATDVDERKPTELTRMTNRTIQSAP